MQISGKAENQPGESFSKSLITTVRMPPSLFQPMWEATSIYPQWHYAFTDIIPFWLNAESPAVLSWLYMKIHLKKWNLWKWPWPVKVIFMYNHLLINHFCRSPVQVTLSRPVRRHESRSFLRQGVLKLTMPSQLLYLKGQVCLQTTWDTFLQFSYIKAYPTRIWSHILWLV